MCRPKYLIVLNSPHNRGITCTIYFATGIYQINPMEVTIGAPGLKTPTSVHQVAAITKGVVSLAFFEADRMDVVEEQGADKEAAVAAAMLDLFDEEETATIFAEWAGLDQETMVAIFEH